MNNAYALEDEILDLYAIVGRSCPSIAMALHVYDLDRTNVSSLSSRIIYASRKLGRWTMGWTMHGISSRDNTVN